MYNIELSLDSDEESPPASQLVNYIQSTKAKGNITPDSSMKHPTEEQFISTLKRFQKCMQLRNLI